MCNCDRNVKQKTCWQRRAVVNVSKDRNKLTLPPSSYIIQAAARHKKCHRKDLHQVKQKIIAVLALSQVDLLRLVTVYCLVPCLNVTRQSDSEWGRMSEKTKCNDNKNRGFLCAFFSIFPIRSLGFLMFRLLSRGFKHQDVLLWPLVDPRCLASDQYGFTTMMFFGSSAAVTAWQQSISFGHLQHYLKNKIKNKKNWWFCYSYIKKFKHAVCIQLHWQSVGFHKNRYRFPALSS